VLLMCYTVNPTNMHVSEVLYVMLLLSVAISWVSGSIYDVLRCLLSGATPPCTTPAGRAAGPSAPSIHVCISPVP
jgi:hypothetical protein